MDPDELYTLRAQYWLGHYNLCLDEARSIARRPMAPQLKIEREELHLRALLELKQYDNVVQQASSTADQSPGVQALLIRAKYASPSTPASSKAQLLSELQQIISNPSAETSTAQLIAAQTFLSHGEMTKEALACVHNGSTLEHLALSTQIYIKMDRYDLAFTALQSMKAADEESILTQLSSVYLNLANGRSQVQDAIHSLTSLTEQYGNSPMLLNLVAAAQIIAGNYEVAERVLMECVSEEQQGQGSSGSSSDTLINLVVCYQHLGRGMGVIGPVLEQLKSAYSDHAFVQGLARVEGAFERESIKYKVAA
jgi:coatomer protein complex subunit epsilon